VRQKKIPFEVSAVQDEPLPPPVRIMKTNRTPEKFEDFKKALIIPKNEKNDSFWSDTNLRVLHQSMRDAEAGKFAKVTTMEELWAMENT